MATGDTIVNLLPPLISKRHAAPRLNVEAAFLDFPRLPCSRSVLMSDAADIADDRHSRILAELAGLSLALARDLQARAMEAESAEDATRLAAAFQGVARGLRQTLALELKVIRHKDAAAARPADQPSRAEAQVHRLQAETVARVGAHRRRRVRERLDHAFHPERPDWLTPELDAGVERPRRPPPGDPLWDRLETFLDGAEVQPDFLTRDFDLLVIDACEAIGLDPGLLYEIVDRRESEPADSS
jgi:hypothetical protein